MICITLDHDDAVKIPGPLSRALLETRLIDLIPMDNGDLAVRRNRRHVIGRIAIPGAVIVVPPPMPAELLIDLIVWTDTGVTPKGLAVPVPIVRGADPFSFILAASLVEEVLRQILPRIRKRYVSVVERACLIHGRPLWAKGFGRHPSSGIEAKVFRLQSDHMLNRLLLAGVECSVAFLPAGELRLKARHAARLLQSLCGSLTPKEEHFRSAFARLDRLTFHYAPALALAQAIVMRRTVDVLGRGIAPVPGIELDLAILFERFLTRLVRESLRGQAGVTVWSQVKEGAAFVDGDLKEYRAVQPDIIVSLNGKPIMVMDAKFKPRYLCTPSELPVKKANRITNDDLFQLYFYQAHLSQKYCLAMPPKAVLVAPLLESGSLPNERWRNVAWGSSMDGHYGLALEALSLHECLGELRNGSSAANALMTGAPSLFARIEKLLVV